MSEFSIEQLNPNLTGTYLDHLQLDREQASLDFLNCLIKAHQKKVPFESFSRIIDFHQYPGKLPPIEIYVKRLSTGAGGVCWTLARGFGWLLHNLQFDVQYLYMEPGHVCLKVHLDQDYYVDVGYAAPFFQAMPLSQPFEIQAPSEIFQFRPKNEKVTVTRTPGPQKFLHLTPFSPANLEEKFQSGNVWGKNRFLSILTISLYQDEKLIRLTNGKFQDFRPIVPNEQALSENEIPHFLKDTFSIHPDYYIKARKLLSGN